MEHGVTGEIAIQSPYLASGYWDKPVLTREKFQTNNSGKQFYLTGDIGRLNNYGQLEFLGRKDNMVKVRGFSVQLETIDQAIQTLLGVQAALTSLKTSRRGNQLVMYMIPDKNNLITIPEIRDKVQKILPQHMLPSRYIWLNRFPTTRTGKIDRNHLPHPTTSRPVLSTPYRPPSTETEKKLAETWRTILDLDKIGGR